MKDFVETLRTTAWRTAGARYNAARRMKQREIFSTVSLALLSALSVAAAVAQKVYSPKSDTPLDNYLTVVSVALGVILLTISLLEWGAANGAKADGLHRNADELTAYQMKLAQVLAEISGGRVLGAADTDALRIEYQTIKGTCQYNHAPQDDRLFMAHHRNSPEFRGPSGSPKLNRWAAFFIWLRWQWSTLWFFGVVWLGVLVTVAYAWCLPVTG